MKKPKGKAQPNSMYSTLLRKQIVPAETLDDAFVIDFVGVYGQFEKILSDSGIVSMKRLGNKRLQKCINQYLNLRNDHLKGIFHLRMEFRLERSIAHCSP